MMNHVDDQSTTGGARGGRTPDLYNAIVALSQLSYGPSDASPCNKVAPNCKRQKW